MSKMALTWSEAGAATSADTCTSTGLEQSKWPLLDGLDGERGDSCFPSNRGFTALCFRFPSQRFGITSLTPCEGSCGRSVTPDTNPKNSSRLTCFVVSDSEITGISLDLGSSESISNNESELEDEFGEGDKPWKGFPKLTASCLRIRSKESLY